MENINYNDFKNICRTCLFKSDLKPLQDNVIIEVLHKLGVDFETYDELPQQICINCFEKINEINKFTLRCNETNSSLMKCLNNFKNNRLNEKRKIEETNEPVNIKEEIKIEEHQIPFIPDNNYFDEFNSTNLKIKEELIETSNYEPNEDVIPETTEFINVKIEDTSNIELENEEESISDENLDDSEENETENSSFSSDSSDIDNISMKKKSKIYKCDACNKTFFHLASLKIHENLPSCEHLFKCEECPKTFEQEKYLKKHMLLHTCERPHTCVECSKSFKQAKNLKEHMLVHSAVRPHKCGTCSKSFKQASYLKRHMRVHNAERPYKCVTCSKSFIRANNLKQHMFLHTGERPHTCAICSKSFKLAYNLKGHMRVHSDERPQKCAKCSKSFKHASDLKRHIMLGHSA